MGQRRKYIEPSQKRKVENKRAGIASKTCLEFPQMILYTLPPTQV